MASKELHPDFVRETLVNDLCLIQMDEPLIFTQNIKPICLNSTPLNKNEPNYIAGWGLTEEGGSQVSCLLKK